MRTHLTLLTLITLAACGAPPTEVGDDEAALATQPIINSTNNLVASEGWDCVEGALSYGMTLTKAGAWVAPSWVDGATII